MMIRFFLATLLPVALLVLASAWGGIWAVLALGCMTALALGLDQITRSIAPPLPGLSAAAALARGLGLAHFGLWVLAITALGNGWLHSLTEKAVLFLAFGIFFGQISNSVAHELIHAPNRWAQRLGQWVYTSLLFGHHNSAHRLVHHSHVATDMDPNSARYGENFYSFFLRSWDGSFRAGMAAETARRTGMKSNTSLHPYVGYVSGAIGFLLLAAILGGLSGVLWFLALALYAQMQLMLSDYVQHYGLRRHARADGKPEPVGPQHSWNAPHWYSASMMLNAPRHSDHHMKPAKPFETLDLNAATMPMLPYSVPVMAVIALIPPLWRRVMHRRLRKWQSPAQ